MKYLISTIKFNITLNVLTLTSTLISPLNSYLYVHCILDFK